VVLRIDPKKELSRPIQLKPPSVRANELGVCLSPSPNTRSAQGRLLLSSQRHVATDVCNPLLPFSKTSTRALCGCRSAYGFPCIRRAAVFTTATHFGGPPSPSSALSAPFGSKDRASDAPSPLQPLAIALGLASFWKDRAWLHMDPREQFHDSSGKDAFHPQVPPKRNGPFRDLSTASQSTVPFTETLPVPARSEREGLSAPSSIRIGYRLQTSAAQHNPRAQSASPDPKGPSRSWHKAPEGTLWREFRCKHHRA